MYQPSDYLEAIKTTLGNLIIWKDDQEQEHSFQVEDYAEFGRININRRTLFIELSKAKGTNTYPDGRVYEDMDVAIHAVFPNSVDYAAKQANNCSFDIRDLVVLDVGPKVDRSPRWSWGLDSDSTEKPQNVDRMPSIYATGNKGYEGWCVTFVQRVIYGEPDAEEESRESIYIATNDSVDNPDDYEELNT